MNTFQFVPEGWNKEVENLNLQKIQKYKEENKIVQGIVKSCDKKYNLHIQLGNKIEGIIPRCEVEDIGEGLPDERLCTGKVHKYVQFRIENIENVDGGDIKAAKLENDINSIVNLANRL